MKMKKAGQLVPIEKMSKRARRALYKARRGSWGEVNPVTRRAPNPKAYDRKKARSGEPFSGPGSAFRDKWIFQDLFE